jgi:hypothetical protein
MMGGSLLALMMLKPTLAQTEESKSKIPSFLPKLEIPAMENKKDQEKIQGAFNQR